jgi:group I intron endonuclease
VFTQVIDYKGVFMHFVYVIENKITGKLYVGQTICPKNRRKQHFSRTPHGNPLLDRAVLKYGRANFDFSTIEELETLEEANSREAYWITYLRTLVPGGYNLKEGGEAGGPDSLETRLKKSRSKL